MKTKPRGVGIAHRHCTRLLVLLSLCGVPLLPACGVNPAGGGVAASGGNDNDNGGTVPSPSVNDNDNAVDGDTALPETYTLTISVVGQGTTSPSPGTVVRDAGQQVTLTATAADDWEFVGWSGDLADTWASIDVVMDRDRSVTATFESLDDDDAPSGDDGDLPRFYLPWAPGETRTIGQANNGQYTHQGHFAWDIAMNIGTPLLAIAPGRVIRADDNHPDNPLGFPDDPDTPSNAVWIDHGDGLQAVYAHLTPGGAKVVAGQLVAAGQCIGLSGNSGYSSGPHLHYEILDVASQSTPSGFVEVVGNNGVAEEGDVLTSENELDVASVVDFVDSALPTDAFAVNKIELFEPTPPAFFYTAGVEYTIAGTVPNGDEFACVSLVDPDSGQTVYCQESLVQVGSNGVFDIVFAFPETLTGQFGMGVVSGTGGVSGNVPIRIFVAEPPTDNTPPVAAIIEPTDNAIDFGERGTLNGSASSDPDGDAMSYQWTRISGPPATIADASARSTSFTLEVGEGIARVAFQLVVFDGQAHSLPALVEHEMADAFAVSEIGLSQTECADLEECQFFDTQFVALDVGQLCFWAQLLNVIAGDVSSIEILDASGAVVLQGEKVHDKNAGLSFLRMSWTFSGPIGTPGSWSAIYRRNSQVEGTISFSAF